MYNYAEFECIDCVIKLCLIPMQKLMLIMLMLHRVHSSARACVEKIKLLIMHVRP